MLIEFALYLLIGSVVGTLAGLLGVGGGLIIVPVLASLFSTLGIPPAIIMHLALGTSLASILVTSLASVYSHHKHAAVNWSNAARLSPGVLAGAWGGAILASVLSSDILKPGFACFELLVAMYMLWGGGRVSPHNSSPSLVNFSLSGGAIGFVSSLVGIGGGTISVPWLMWHGSSIHKAIATSSALGFPIALSATTGYIFGGWNNPLLPDHSIGFIYLPALGGIILTSVIFAPIGASLAHNMNVARLRKTFAFLLVILAAFLFTL